MIIPHAVFTVVAQTSTGGAEPWLFTQGVLGIVVLGLLGVVRALWRERDAYQLRERESTIKVYGEIIPVLTRSTEVADAVTTALHELREELRQVRDELRRHPQ